MNAIDGDKLIMILDGILELSTDLEEKYTSGAVDLLKLIIQSGLLNCIPEPPPPPLEPEERKPALWVWRQSSDNWGSTVRTSKPKEGDIYVPNALPGWCPVYE